MSTLGSQGQNADPTTDGTIRSEIASKYTTPAAGTPLDDDFKAWVAASDCSIDTLDQLTEEVA